MELLTLESKIQMLERDVLSIKKYLNIKKNKYYEFPWYMRGSNDEYFSANIIIRYPPISWIIEIVGYFIRSV